MSLRVWLPLNGDLRNNGIEDVTITNNGATVDNNGKIGKCYRFNGSNNYLFTPFNFYNTTYSVSAWIYSTSSSSTQTIVCDRTKVGYGFSIFLIGGKLRIDAGGNSLQWTTGYTYPINTWFHLTIVHDGINVSYYINGNFKERKAQALSASYWGNITSIGASQTNGSGYGNYLNGYINDVRIYDHALSETEIKKISQGLILHYPLNRNGFGQENLMKNSHTKLNNAGYYVGTYAFANPSELVTGEKYTFSFSGELQDETQTGWYFNIFPSPYTHIGSISTTEDGRYSFTFTMPENGGSRTSIGCYSTPLGNYKGCAIWDVKLEKGEVATPWCPNSADTEYTTLGLDGNIEYDLSGYNRNAVRTNGITYDSDSPKYNVSSVFDGHPYTYVKCDSIDWMIPMTELTISCWCYMDDWTWFGKGYGRLWSCTEGGGFNVEWLNSKMEFAICTSPSGYLPSEAKCGVTLSDLTSGWHSFIYVYTTAGTRLYIDGNLYKSYEISSNYVSYNTNARLFLGCEANGSSEYSPYFKGKMSDFRLYVTALSQADIAELYSIHRS